ncbi:hypothetical protein [Corallococcus macrosporus]|uniref:Putative lipoprotein n=1 Tax=Myxococcus fulvus (strain ATCC BAA-855 / HW-1) TaxID=483219 RepID=F8C8C0_MYXFH|nr:hypothetical protein [Corallococcus macrosporus]AEI68247.1 putative lipoprotein [Corallococcus macrosporus]
MSLRLLSPLLLLGLGACGPDAEPVGRFPLALTLERAVANDVQALQVAVVTRGSSRSCIEIERTCLGTQVRRDDLVVLKDAQGREGRALRFPVDLATLQSGGSLELAVEVPVGRDYALVIEAITTGATPGFLGSSCNYLREVNAGDNPPVIAAPLTLTGGDCNPSIAP